MKKELFKLSKYLKNSGFEKESSLVSNILKESRRGMPKEPQKPKYSRRCRGNPNCERVFERKAEGKGLVLSDEDKRLAGEIEDIFLAFYPGIGDANELISVGESFIDTVNSIFKLDFDGVSNSSAGFALAAGTALTPDVLKWMAKFFNKNKEHKKALEKVYGKGIEDITDFMDSNNPDALRQKGKMLDTLGDAKSMNPDKFYPDLSKEMKSLEEYKDKFPKSRTDKIDLFDKNQPKRKGFSSDIDGRVRVEQFFKKIDQDEIVENPIKPSGPRYRKLRSGEIGKEVLHPEGHITFEPITKDDPIYESLHGFESGRYKLTNPSGPFDVKTISDSIKKKEFFNYNKLIKLSNFLNQAGFKKEELYLRKILKISSFAVSGRPPPPPQLDSYDLKEIFYDIIHMMRIKDIGAEETNIYKRPFVFEIENHCRFEDVMEKARYIRSHISQDEYEDKMLRLSIEFYDELWEIDQRCLNETLGSIRVESPSDLEGYDGPLSSEYSLKKYLKSYLENEFYIEINNYLASRENLANELLPEVCNYIKETYSALKRKEEGSRKIDEQIKNVSNACQSYMQTTLDELENNISSYDESHVLAATSCILHDGSYYEPFEYSNETKSYLKVNYKNIYSFIFENN